MSKPIVWSYGGGVQSTAILCLVAQGKLPAPDVTIMADTSHERSSTWRYLSDHAMPIMDSIGIEFTIAPHSLAKVDLYSHKGDLLIPAFSQKGKLHSFCSNEWKQRVVRRALRSMGFGPQNPIVMWLGMSIDELDRMKHADKKWVENYYPLIESIRLSRVRCKAVIQNFGLPIPPQSCCKFCPNMTNREWLEMRETDPDDFQEAVRIALLINDNDKQGGVYLHDSRQPIELVDFSSPTMRLPFNECAGSTCWT